MKNLKNIPKAFFAFLLVPCFVFSKCNKDIEPEKKPEYYIRCKIDGKNYLPNNCANCMTGQILGDTVIMLQANRGFEALTIGVINKPKIEMERYLLNDVVASRGTYKYSTTTTDRYYTNGIYTGQLSITTLDKVNKIVAGTFYFQAYNSVQDKTVNVTNGEFKLKYTDY